MSCGVTASGSAPRLLKMLLVQYAIAYTNVYHTSDSIPTTKHSCDDPELHSLRCGQCISYQLCAFIAGLLWLYMLILNIVYYFVID